MGGHFPAAVETVQAPTHPADTALAAPDAPAPAKPAAATDAEAPAASAAPAPAVEEEDQSIEVLTTLGNERLEITTSTHGAGIVRAAILGYPSVKGSDVPVTFDFSDRPAAAPIGYPGLAPRAGFEIAASTDASITYRKVLAGGLVLDRMAEPPLLVAVAAKRFSGEWAVSLRSRSEMAGKVVGMLRDGKKVRGGGHDDSAALYFPPSYSPDQIRTTLQAAMRTIRDQERPTGVTLGDLFKTGGQK